MSDFKCMSEIKSKGAESDKDAVLHRVSLLIETLDEDGVVLSTKRLIVEQSPTNEETRWPDRDELLVTYWDRCTQD